METGREERRKENINIALKQSHKQINQKKKN
jgi:hypothetical protein